MDIMYTENPKEILAFILFMYPLVEISRRLINKFKRGKR